MWWMCGLRECPPGWIVYVVLWRRRYFSFLLRNVHWVQKVVYRCDASR